jgi:hypothetical protein
MTLKKAVTAKPKKPESGIIDRVINAGSPPAQDSENSTEKDIKFQMVIPPELGRAIDDARKPTKTSRRAWLLQAAQEKLEKEGKFG